MPFDGANFPKQPRRSRGAKPPENLVSGFIIVVAFTLLIFPISLGAFADIVRYLSGH